MKDEIKEILEQSLDYEFNLTFKQRKELLDYITDLQDILKDREEYCYGLETQITNLQEEYEIELDENYKLSEWLVKKQKRIEKAREHIKKEIADIEWIKEEYSDYDKIGEIEVELKSIEELNDILNGDDSDE